MGSDDQQLTDVLVAEPADPAQPLLATGGSLPRHESKPGREFPPTTEDVGVRHGGSDGGGNQRPDARDGGEPPADRIGLVPSHDPGVDLGDPLPHLVELSGEELEDLARQLGHAPILLHAR